MQTGAAMALIPGITLRCEGALNMDRQQVKSFKPRVAFRIVSASPSYFRF